MGERIAMTDEESYSTSEVAHIIGIHPNTVRLYEELGLITKPLRRENGYRVFTALHIAQFKIARLAFQVEVLQNGLRKQAAAIIRTCAAGDFDEALRLTHAYMDQIEEEKENAEAAIRIAEQILGGEFLVSRKSHPADDRPDTAALSNTEAPPPASLLRLTRKETAEYLHITIDTLRNWELNGLLTVKRRENGYRIYTDSDIGRLIIIKSLRCANYSLSAILRMLSVLSTDPAADLRTAIDIPQPDDDVLTACDHLLTSLTHAEANAKLICRELTALKEEKNINPPL